MVVHQANTSKFVGSWNDVHGTSNATRTKYRSNWTQRSRMRHRYAQKAQIRITIFIVVKAQRNWAVVGLLYSCVVFSYKSIFIVWLIKNFVTNLKIKIVSIESSIYILYKKNIWIRFHVYRYIFYSILYNQMIIQNNFYI